MIIYKALSGPGVTHTEFYVIKQELQESDGTADLLMRLQARWPDVATERKRDHLAIMLDGNPRGFRTVYVCTQVLMVEHTEYRYG